MQSPVPQDVARVAVPERIRREEVLDRARRGPGREAAEFVRVRDRDLAAHEADDELVRVQVDLGDVF